MNDLEEAEAGLTAAVEHAQALRVTGNAELRSAVARGPGAAADLLASHLRLRAANRLIVAAYARVSLLREAAGLAAPSRCPTVAPDFGPVPAGEAPQPMCEAWIRLLGRLNAGDVADIARQLSELNGWLPGQPQAMPETTRDQARAPGT